jgi:predicted O-methyltransferase YrrM
MCQVVRESLARYIDDLHGPVDDVVDAIGREGRAEGLPLVEPTSARLLRAMVLASGARRVLEIGTAIGYSALCMAQVMPPDGQLISLEIDPARAARARANVDRAGLAGRVSIIVGDASRFLHKVAGPFDLAFQDGAKTLYEPLLDRLDILLRPGGVLVSDNVLRGGRVAASPELSSGSSGPEAADAEIRALQAYNRTLAAEPRLFTTFVAVGDGLSVSVKLPER